MSMEERIESLGLIFQERYGLVLATARRFAPSEDRVEDIIQQVYIDFVYGGAEKNWDLDREAAPLLFKIVKDKALLARREQSRRKECPIDELVNHLDDSALFAAEDETTEFETMSDEIHALEHCLEQLPPKVRRMVRRHYYHGETIKSIGQRESLGMSAVYRLFRKARSALKTCIEQTFAVSQKRNE